MLYPLNIFFLEDKHMENEMLTKLYGEFCSLCGEMSEFKKRTIERLDELEKSFRQSTAEQSARLCRFVSIGTGCIALASAVYAAVSKFFS